MAQIVTNRHPIRAALWGFLLGLGIAIYLVVFSVIGLDNAAGVVTKVVIVVLIVMALSVVWGLFGPARKPRGAPPGTVTDDA